MARIHTKIPPLARSLLNQSVPDFSPIVVWLYNQTSGSFTTILIHQDSRDLWWVSLKLILHVCSLNSHNENFDFNSSPALLVPTCTQTWVTNCMVTSYSLQIQILIFVIWIPIFNFQFTAPCTNCFLQNFLSIPNSHTNFKTIYLNTIIPTHM